MAYSFCRVQRILGEINIGDHSIIGAGSVVVNDVPPCAVVVGNPARVIKILDLDNENPPNP
jgi:serine acetyltransferase